MAGGKILPAILPSDGSSLDVSETKKFELQIGEVVSLCPIVPGMALAWSRLQRIMAMHIAIIMKGDVFFSFRAIIMLSVYSRPWEEVKLKKQRFPKKGAYLEFQKIFRK